MSKDKKCNESGCECNKPREVRFEFYEFNQNKVLVLENPAELTFTNVSTIPGNTITINNIFKLSTWRDNVNGTAFFPAQVILKTNDNEIDKSSYILTITAGEGTLQVIAKYYK